MKATIFTAIVLSMGFSTHLDAATGITLKIVLNGPGLTQPLEISDTRVRGFHVWEGPGVYVNGVEQTEGFIIQWSRGAVADRPTGLREFDVQFYAGCPDDWDCSSKTPRLVYQVSYAYDPARNQGFVYLPGKHDDTFKVNTAIWHGHGLEGNWFRATSEWETFVRPIIAAAMRTQR